MVVRARRAQQGRLRQVLGLLHAHPVLPTQIQRLGATLSPDAHAMLGIQEQMNALFPPSLFSSLLPFLCP